MKTDPREDVAGDIRLRPIGVIRTPFSEARGTPIQPSMAKGTEGTVEVFVDYREGLKDLDGFDRVWLIYWCHRASTPRLLVTPYLDDQSHGLFATRAPARPNPIGISAVRLVGIEDNILKVADVDILDGTPLLDIKPYVPQFDSYEAGRCGWLDKLSAKRHVADGRFEDNHE